MIGWTAIIPIKPPGLSKSRLEVEPSAREQLARAFALDVLDAVAATSSVLQSVVVTADTMIAAHARTRGMLTVADRPMLSAEGLNDAVRVGRDWAVCRWPSSPVAVIPADLPSITSTVLGATLERLAAAERCFVPDAGGTGTTILTSLDPAMLRPLFGPRSAFRHAEDGVRPVIEVDRRIRRDVDTVADLAESRLHGVGCWTAAILAAERARSHQRRLRPHHSVGVRS
ncbi:MAG: 2-phospho-L-lactate guanylyltransferase [Aeromicrobium sp.]